MTDAAAMDYLESIEAVTCHIDMAKDRAACAEYPHIPSTAADVLAWMEDELQIQRDQHGEHPEEGRDEYIVILERDVAKVRELGVTPDLRVFAT
jgi:hypothetical protein